MRSISRRMRARGYSGTEFHLRLTREELGSLLGLQLETVSRAFSSLRRSGIIAYEKQDEVGIPNVCRLCHLTGSH